MITDPTLLIAFLASLLGALLWLARQKQLASIFRFAPVVVWAYFAPMVLNAIGVIPTESDAYSWMARYLLPFGLFLLTLTVDLPALLRLGRISALMMIASVGSVMAGVMLAYFLFGPFLPQNAWQGMTILSATWIGGGANALAWHQSLGAADDVLGSIAIVDTIVGYGWLGVVIAFSAYQKRFDQWTRTDSSVIEEVQRKIQIQDETRRPIEIDDFGMIVGLGLGVTALCRIAADALPSFGDPTIISTNTWAVMLSATAGLLCSMTRIRKLEDAGASRIGYAMFLLLMTSIGAKASFSALLDAPIYLAAGVFAMTTHVFLLVMAARLLKAPMALFATSSMASIGGAISAPIAAAAYNRSLAPLGVLLGVFGYLVGVYAPTLVAYVLSATS